MAPLATTVKRLREARGLSQVQLAARARVTQGFISRLEGGYIQDLTLKTAIRLARVLKVDVTRLAT